MIINRRFLSGFFIAASLLIVFSFQNQFVDAANANLYQGGTWAEKVDPNIFVALNLADRVDFRVRFSSHPDLSAAEGMDWHSRGWFVYQTLVDTARKSQQEAVTYLEENVISFQSYFAGNDLFVWGGDQKALRTLASLSNVSKIYAPRVYTIADYPYQDPLVAIYHAPLDIVSNKIMNTVETLNRSEPTSLSWAIEDVKADQFWSAFSLRGEGVFVANIDTGVQWDHPALINAYKCQDNPGDPACWFDPLNDCGGIPCDTNGHGTATMGPMVGDDDQTLPYQVGVAPGAQWIACKGCDGAYCSESALTACADWMLAPGGNPDNRPHIVSNSWGGQGCDDWFSPYVDAWRAAGIAPAFSPGGGGPGCVSLGSPGDYMTVVSSTAHDLNRVVGSFAGRGPSCFGTAAKPDISAPGVNLCLPVPTDNWSCYNGTSFSNAYGAGSLALLMSCAPGLQWNVDSLFEALEDTADLPASGYCGAPPDGDGNYTYGHGYINLLAAGQIFCENQAMGFLSGYVYDQIGTTPLEDATILAEKWGSGWQAITNTYPSGYYSMTLQAGTYSVSVDLLHYTPVVTDGVIITAEQTTNLDFYLLPQARLFGYVTDDEHGAPLAAMIQANDVVTETDPLDGFYELYLDEGDYQVQVTADGYTSESVSISLAAGVDLQLDFQLIPETYPLTPTASFLSNSPLTIGETAIFTNTSDPGNPPEPKFLWDFGDSYTSTLENPSHIYLETGSYTVTLEVCNPIGCNIEENNFAVFDQSLADLSVKKIDLVDPVNWGDNLYYQITIYNYGPDVAVNLILTDNPDYPFSLVAASSGCYEDDENIKCTYPQISPGEEIIVVLIIKGSFEPGLVLNSVEVSSDMLDMYPENNVNSETTLIQPNDSFKLLIPIVLK